LGDGVACPADGVAVSALRIMYLLLGVAFSGKHPCIDPRAETELCKRLTSGAAKNLSRMIEPNAQP